MKPAAFGYLLITQIRDDGKLDTVASFNLANDQAASLAKHVYDQLRWTEGDEFFVFNTASVPTQLDASAMDDTEVCTWIAGEWQTMPLIPIEAIWRANCVIAAARMVS